MAHDLLFPVMSGLVFKALLDVMLPKPANLL